MHRRQHDDDDEDKNNKHGMNNAAHHMHSNARAADVRVYALPNIGVCRFSVLFFFRLFRLFCFAMKSNRIARYVYYRLVYVFFSFSSLLLLWWAFNYQTRTHTHCSFALITVSLCVCLSLAVYALLSLSAHKTSVFFFCLFSCVHEHFRFHFEICTNVYESRIISSPWLISPLAYIRLLFILYFALSPSLSLSRALSSHYHYYSCSKELIGCLRLPLTHSPPCALQSLFFFLFLWYSWFYILF